MSKEKYISIYRITPDPNQPRKTFNHETLQELANSIKSVGLINAIVVRPFNDIYTIITGERRYRACKLADKKTIRSRILDVNETDALLLQIIEDSQEPFPLDERADAWYSLYIKLKKINPKYTKRQFSERIGKSTNAIFSAFSFHELDDRVKELFRKKALQYRFACEISKVEENNIEYEFAVRSIINDWSYPKLCLEVREHKNRLEIGKQQTDLTDILKDESKRMKRRYDHEIKMQAYKKMKENLLIPLTYLKKIKALYKIGEKRLPKDGLLIKSIDELLENSKELKNYLSEKEKKV